MSLIERVNSPEDLKLLTENQLEDYAAEIRDFLIEKVAASGGHLGPNLGVVELTIAVHRIFNSPNDPIIFDTGHQAYVNKIITGRANKFDYLRQKNGLSGYPDRAESKHDWVESSHASSSLSTVFGLAKSFAISGETDRKVVAVIGDGALTGGMAWEALNNIAGSNLPIVIIVNDNGRSYAPTVGGMANHLSNLRMNRSYEKAMSSTKSLLNKTPVFGKIIYRLLHGFKTGVRDVVIPEAFFSDLGIKYLGPINGHDIRSLENTLQLAKDYSAPVVVHVVTKKGHGYTFAENDVSDQMHTTGIINPATGKPKRVDTPGATEVFADSLLKAGKNRDDLVAITAAMSIPTGIYKFAEEFPERTIDVGIAEQHALTTASGLALGGKHPVVAIYSTFFNRAFDQFLMDVSLLHLPVTMVLDRAGITGSDGPSHNGMWDISLLSIIPGIKVASPRDKESLKEEFSEAIATSNKPTVLRFSKGPIAADIKAEKRLADGSDLLYSSKDSSRNNKEKKRILILTVGNFASIGIACAEILAAENFVVKVVDPRWIFPISDFLIDYINNFDYLITVEDGLVTSGYGAAISAALIEKLPLDKQQHIAIKNFGIPKEFLKQSSRKEILADLRLEAPLMAADILKWLSN